MRINGVVIAQAGSRSEFLGRLDLDVQNDRVASYSGRLLPVRSSAPSPDRRMHDLVEDYRKRIESRYGTVIGSLKTAWSPARNRESNVGDFFADVIRERTGAEIAVINSGGIRKGMPKGALREMDIYEVYPFDNRLVRFQCSGGQVLQLIRSNAAAAFSGSRGILAGVRSEVQGETRQDGKDAGQRSVGGRETRRAGKALLGRGGGLPGAGQQPGVFRIRTEVFRKTGSSSRRCGRAIHPFPSGDPEPGRGEDEA